MIKELFFSIALVVTSSVMANAGESVIPPTPIGGTDIGQAILPPTGLYGGMGIIPFDRTEQFHGFGGLCFTSGGRREILHVIVLLAFLTVQPFRADRITNERIRGRKDAAGPLAVVVCNRRVTIATRVNPPIFDPSGRPLGS